MTTLPPLPKLDTWESGVCVRQDVCQQRMTAYGQACREQALSEAIKAVPQEPACNANPDAPHGFSRNNSHTEGRYVCECESWSAVPQPLQGEIK